MIDGKNDTRDNTNRSATLSTALTDKGRRQHRVVLPAAQPVPSECNRCSGARCSTFKNHSSKSYTREFFLRGTCCFQKSSPTVGEHMTCPASPSPNRMRRKILPIPRRLLRRFNQRPERRLQLIPGNLFPATPLSLTIRSGLFYSSSSVLTAVAQAYTKKRQTSSIDNDVFIYDKIDT